MELTVVVTVYNIAGYLPRFFDAMAAQSFCDYVLLVLDDGSEDNSLEVCLDYAKNDPRIRVVPHEHVGIARIKNAAMEYIETPFTAFADGDDYVDPDYLLHLMNAIKKYDADLSISRVQYHLESGEIEGSFHERGELFVPRESFYDQLPMLLDDRRLNYVYGKVYRTALLKPLRVEDDVKQGMDTMFNFMYLKQAQSIVLIDDLDYHYIRYSSRSITSYSGSDAYARLLRINLFVEQKCKDMGLLSDKMLYVIDSRVLQSAVWVIDKVTPSDAVFTDKAHQIDEILNNVRYVEAYNRIKKDMSGLSFKPIPPQSGEKYLCKTEKEKKLLQKKAGFLKKMPEPLVRFYHRMKGIKNE